MRRLMAAVLAAGVVVGGIASHGGETTQDFSPYVDDRGSIRIPGDYRSWVFLGSWHVAAENGTEGTAGPAGFHNVYTQASTLEAYRKTGKFPDGAVLVKELLKTETGDLTTGKVSWGTDVEGWFIMVKDNQGRFPGSPFWGNGWGWALFKSQDPRKTVTKNWRRDCLGCHTPAKQTDWVFTQGYPPLRSETLVSQPEPQGRE